MVDTALHVVPTGAFGGQADLLRPTVSPKPVQVISAQPFFLAFSTAARFRRGKSARNV